MTGHKQHMSARAGCVMLITEVQAYYHLLTTDDIALPLAAAKIIHDYKIAVNIPFTNSFSRLAEAVKSISIEHREQFFFTIPPLTLRFSGDIIKKICRMVNTNEDSF